MSGGGDDAPSAVLDTNVFVAAGFRPASASAALLRAAEAGRLRLIWSPATRAETLAVLTRIPRLDPEPAARLLRNGGQRPDACTVGYGEIADPADRKFAALAVAAGATLVTSDAHLLAHRETLPVVTPGAFLARLAQRP